MKLYAVKNDSGEYWDFEYEEWNINTNDNFASSKKCASGIAELHGGHVVELVEKPKPVVVSEDEADMLKEAKDKLRPYMFIYNQSSVSQADRLMRAYANGYTVKPEPRYTVKVPHVATTYYFKEISGELCTTYMNGSKGTQFTLAELEQYGLQDLPREEVGRDAD